jgi:hypothetical protein
LKPLVGKILEIVGGPEISEAFQEISEPKSLSQSRDEISRLLKRWIVYKSSEVLRELRELGKFFISKTT